MQILKQLALWELESQFSNFLIILKTPIPEMERCLAVDSLALLGGNEYLVQQIMDSGNEHAFSKEDVGGFLILLSSTLLLLTAPSC